MWHLSFSKPQVTGAAALFGPMQPCDLGKHKIKRNKASDGTLVWYDGNRVKAHKDNLTKQMKKLLKKVLNKLLRTKGKVRQRM